MEALDLTKDIGQAALALNTSEKELQFFIDQEFETLSLSFGANDPNSDKEYYRQFVLQNILNLQSDPLWLAVTKKLLHRDTDRKFYFDFNKIEAVNRILQAIESASLFVLVLRSLNLDELPSLLRKAKRVTNLDISENLALSAIDAVGALPQLLELDAHGNSIADFSPLVHCPKLEVLNLSGNPVLNLEPLTRLPRLKRVQLQHCNIHDRMLEPLLHHPTLEWIDLTGNPLNLPLEFCQDLAKIRDYYRIPLPKGEPLPDGSPEPEANRVNPAPPPGNKFVPGPKSKPEEEPAEKPASGSVFQKKPSELLSDEPTPHRVTGPFSVFSKPEKNLLRSDRLVETFKDLIINARESEEQFFALFGRWGRGKTHFWTLLKERVARPGEKTKFHTIEFQAWKYQDTPAVWAYLYDVISRRYNDRPKKLLALKAWFGYYRKLFLLNRCRGTANRHLVRLFARVSLAVLGVVFLSQLEVGAVFLSWIKRNWWWGAVLISPALLQGFFSYLNKNYRQDARKILASLTAKVNFESHLGLQHEIQHELCCLLQVWIPRPEESNERILLFIDDIDRCSEEKIIQIVDYIRVLLHHPEIQKRLTVVAAIDERILIHAIRNKYNSFISDGEKGAKDSPQVLLNDTIRKQLCREYIDKLFIASLKLGPLTDGEKREIMEGFTASITRAAEAEKAPPADTEKDPSAPVTGPTGIQEGPQQADGPEKEPLLPHFNKNLVYTPRPNDPTSHRSATAPGPAVGSSGQPEVPAPVDEPGAVPLSSEESFALENWEQDYLEDILARYSDPTPRSIRVYTLRYLLGKCLIEHALPGQGRVRAQWFGGKRGKQYFALQLLRFAFVEDTDTLGSSYGSLLRGEKGEGGQNVLGNPFNIELELDAIIHQALTMTVAY